MGSGSAEASAAIDPPGGSIPVWSRMGLLERFEWSGVVVGLILRAWEFGRLRVLYLDEKALLSNLVGVPVLDFHHVLKQDQLAPPGFLAIGRLAVRLPMIVAASGRLLPLICGLASMLLIVPLARRYLTRLAVPIAAWMMALSDHLIYYSNEIKPYSCDLVAAMAALLIAAPRDPAGPSTRRLAWMIAFGLIAPWFSFPVVFVLAGVGLHWIARRATAGDGRGVVVAALICVSWLASFGGCFWVSRSIVAKGDFLWRWWDFAFLPIPPKDPAQAQFVAETLANVFINPGSLLTPFGFPITAALACVLATFGCVSIGRRWAGGLFLLLSPLAFTLAASALRHYPFHGRLLLGLVPTYQLLLAEGIASLDRRARPRSAVVLASVFLLGMVPEVFWNLAVLQNTRPRPYDSHGDLKSDLLDHLDRQRSLQKKPRTARASGPLSHSTSKDRSSRER